MDAYRTNSTETTVGGPMDLREVMPEELENMRKRKEKAIETKLKKAAKLQAQQTPTTSSSEKKKNVKGEAEEENPEDCIDPVTPSGEKKKLCRRMAKTYNPSAVENSWYEWWEKSNFFEADSKSSKPPFVIVLPPPNITGALHIGNAINAAIQDTVIRWRRMSGYDTLWVPGIDHAGIATQAVVEKKLMRELKLTSHDVGRERFVSEVWQWKNKYGATIVKQLRQLGASLDWSKECFTMDGKRSMALTEAFVRLHNEGLIYRDVRVVNWDCVLRTAISDIEVEYIEIKERTKLSVPGYEDPVEFGVLTSFAYPLERGLGEIVVSTTRAETMLGATAIAVHPHDPRYSHLHGKFAIHPLCGWRLLIICDSKFVDMNFGTGAITITPAHDPNDFEVAELFNLSIINIFTDDGELNDYCPSDFIRMPRFKARVAVTEAFKEKGLYRGDKDIELRLGICSVTNGVIEHLIKPQWYVNCKIMAQQGLNAVIDDKNPKMEITPNKYVAEWQRRFENISDWCVSRQIWWGHRIPAWYVLLVDDDLDAFGSFNKQWVVARNEEEAQVKARRLFSGKNFQLLQDPDVLDTWFSSGVYLLSVLGWPDDAEELRALYPTSVLETGCDTLFLWVARMVMLGMKLRGDVPFRKVYLHPVICDAHGRKMSKSLGNVIEPLEVINGVTLENLHKRLEEENLDPDELKTAKEGLENDFPKGIPECGADALRFALVSYAAESDRINLDIERVVGYRQWCNKLWNAVRFTLAKLGDDYTPPVEIDPAAIPFSCKWILTVLNKAITKTILSLGSYEFSDAATAVYSWWHFQLCDVFIEVIKPYFADDDSTFASARRHTLDTLWFCLDYGLRLLHPFMPFITEELWQRLPCTKNSVRKESIVISEYPSPVKSWSNDDVELEMDMIESVVRSLRSLRSLLPPNEIHERPAAFVRCSRNDARDIIKRHELEIATLANLPSLDVLSKSEDTPLGCEVDVVNKALSVFLKQKGTINFEGELEKLRKKMEEIQIQYGSLMKKRSSAGYQERVPAHIREAEEAKLASLMQELLSLKEANQHIECENA